MKVEPNVKASQDIPQNRSQQVSPCLKVKTKVKAGGLIVIPGKPNS